MKCHPHDQPDPSVSPSGPAARRPPGPTDLAEVYYPAPFLALKPVGSVCFLSFVSQPRIDLCSLVVNLVILPCIPGNQSRSAQRPRKAAEAEPRTRILLRCSNTGRGGREGPKRPTRNAVSPRNSFSTASHVKTGLAFQVQQKSLGRNVSSSVHATHTRNLSAVCLRSFYVISGISKGSEPHKTQFQK